MAHKKIKMSGLESAPFTTGLTEIRLRLNTVSYLLFYVLIPALFASQKGVFVLVFPIVEDKEVTIVLTVIQHFKLNLNDILC